MRKVLLKGENLADSTATVALEMEGEHSSGTDLKVIKLAALSAPTHVKSSPSRAPSPDSAAAGNMSPGRAGDATVLLARRVAGGRWAELQR